MHLRRLVASTIRDSGASLSDNAAQVVLQAVVAIPLLPEVVQRNILSRHQCDAVNTRLLDEAV